MPSQHSSSVMSRHQQQQANVTGSSRASMAAIAASIAAAGSKAEGGEAGSKGEGGGGANVSGSIARSGNATVDVCSPPLCYQEVLCP